MSIRRKLFASVAAPVLTLPLLLQPAYALPSGVDLAPAQSVAPGVIRVQQEVIPEEGGERPKRRERQENAEQPEGERPQRREQRAQQDGGNERPQRRQQQDAEQQQERPRREREKAEEQGGERPRQREQKAEQAEGNERPQRRQQQDAEQQQERPRREREEAEESKPREEPRQRNAEKPDSERPRQREQKAEQGEGKERPKPSREQNADQTKEPTQRQAQDPKPKDEPRQKNAEKPDSERPRQREQQAEKPKDGERPREREQRAEQDKGDQPAKRGEQAKDGQQRPERATSGGERNQQRAVRQSEEQPRLPVENGAAVLDSAKERPDRPRRDGDRPRRDANRADNQQAEERAAPPPRNDADAQANDRVTRQQREQWRERRRELTEERGERLDRRPDFERPRGWDERGPARGGDRDRDDGRTIISIDNQSFVRHNDSRRFYEDGRQPQYERLGDGRFREVVERSDGTRVVTIRNRYGEVVQRSRVVRGGEEYVLYYAPELLEDRRDYTWRDPGDDLPPMRLGVPVEDYIIDTSSEPDRDYYEFLEQPPVERVERPYSLDEVRYSARIRDKVPRIDLDTITFATGSSEIPMNQASSLRKVADAINKVLEKDPSETFLIEGHTDAVGADDSNLVLSDRRAESVAVVLSDAFNIPPENLTTQGYGEQYLKVNTDSANQENRRVTIRRITPLVKPVASNQ